jgi:hypothetical protein
MNGVKMNFLKTAIVGTIMPLRGACRRICIGPTATDFCGAAKYRDVPNFGQRPWHIFLIGVWQGAWDAPPDEVLGAERGKSIRVPLGMGVVVPTDHVHCILANDELTARRKARKQTGRM